LYWEALGHPENDSSKFVFLVYDGITTWSNNTQLEKILLEFLINRQTFLVKPLAMRKMSASTILDIILEPSTLRLHCCDKVDCGHKWLVYIKVHNIKKLPFVSLEIFCCNNMYKQ